jgi:hypothetical protein
LNHPTEKLKSTFQLSNQELFLQSEIVGIVHNEILDSVYKFYENKFNRTIFKDTFSTNEYNTVSISIAGNIMNSRIGLNFDPSYYDNLNSICQNRNAFIEFSKLDTTNNSHLLIDLVRDYSLTLKTLPSTTTNEDRKNFSRNYFYENVDELSSASEKKLFAAVIQVGIYSVTYWGKELYSWVELFNQGEISNNRIVSGGNTLFAYPPSGRDVAIADCEGGLMAGISWGAWGLTMGPVGAGALGLAGFGVGAGVGSLGAIGKHYLWDSIWPK